MTVTSFLGIDGNPTKVSQETVERLRNRLQGTSLTPTDSGYDEARTLWNRMIDRHPALIARCHDASDVQEAVRFAREHGIVMSVRGGGHNIGGRALAEAGLLIDHAHRRHVRLDSRGPVVEVDPGATLGDVDAAIQPDGWVVPSGIVSETGLAGLTLGGGFGWLSRRFGLTCDHLASVEMVAADGDLIDASDDTHPDLLWLLRGGGGGCGIITKFRFHPRKLDSNVMAGPLVRPEAEVEDAFSRFRATTAEAPENMTSMLKLCAAPAAPFLPESMHGTPVAITIVCHTGDPSRAEADLAGLRSAPEPAADLIQSRPFPQFQSMFDAYEPKGRRNYWKSEYVTNLDDHIVRALLEAHRHLPSPHANIKIFQLGGEVSRIGTEHSAAAHRDARFIVVVASAWEDPAEDEANIAWVRECWARVHEHSGRGGYVNFLTEDAGTDERTRAYTGIDLDRVRSVRRQYDPRGLFGGL